MPDTLKNDGHVDDQPRVEARAARWTRHQRHVARGADAIQTGCRAACREQTAAEVLEATVAVRGRKMVERLVYKKDPVTPAPRLRKL